MNHQFSEAIKVKDGVFYHLEYHQARVDRTLAHFFGTKIDLFSLPQHLPDFAKEGMHKCRLVYSKEVEKVEFLPYSFRDIQTVGIMMDDTIDYTYKQTDRSRLNSLLSASGCDDIIIAKNGYLSDASSSNLVFVSPEGLFTPKTYLLSGTKRQQLLDRGIIKELDISLQDLPLYERVLFINAMIDLEDNIGVTVKEIKRQQ